MKVTGFNLLWDEGDQARGEDAFTLVYNGPLKRHKVTQTQPWCQR